MLRGSSRTLEQVAVANSAVTQFHRIQQDAVPSLPNARLLADEVLADEVLADGIAGDARALEAAQLYPFVTEQASGNDDDRGIGGNADLPHDPLDPMWGRLSDRDRALAADFGTLPARVLLSTAHSDVADTDLQQSLPIAAVLAGMLVFVLAGVVVNRARHRKATKYKTIGDGGDSNEDERETHLYALFSE